MANFLDIIMHEHIYGTNDERKSCLKYKKVSLKIMAQLNIQVCRLPQFTQTQNEFITNENYQMQCVAGIGLSRTMSSPDSLVLVHKCIIITYKSPWSGILTTFSKTEQLNMKLSCVINMKFITL